MKNKTEKTIERSDNVLHVSRRASIGPCYNPPGRHRSQTVDYKCKQCGLLNRSTTNNNHSKGTWITVKCDGCGQRGSSWDNTAYKNYPNYNVPGFSHYQKHGG